MPYSLVLNLLPLAPISPGYSQGKHLHALFLNIVSHYDRSLGDYLHEQKTNKAFTISPLQVRGYRLLGTGDKKSSFSKDGFRGDRIQYQHKKPIPVNTPCWWRISLLDESLFRKLTQLWLNINPEKPWHLGSADLKIASILGTSQPNQPWANAIPYDRLYEEASSANNKFTFSFATPTTFGKGKYNNSLPTPESIFKSLRKRWNTYSNIEIPEAELALESLFPSYFNIRTEVISDYSKSKLIGCVGDINYQALGNIDPQQIKYLNTLADFALYCGMGKKTTMGMGMVRRINL
ncbi:CRISPR-associated endoribonuclease Cas6 [Pleurocapsa sp. PCC 7319]|uniref:CRISPR-associated endoribonuclease Cas6 n=1 Tax=Pleurocapsa sp. PCC 7319 TaxID=118161 RepID=UPI0003469B44|nr:CRISPR-associated endoribonuclease Cas6 [Pleurocapsa sp. PCC 7319]